jgi:hypothetical protein
MKDKNKIKDLELKIRKILYENMDSLLIEGDKPKSIGLLNLDRHLFVDTTTALILKVFEEEKTKYNKK